MRLHGVLRGLSEQSQLLQRGGTSSLAFLGRPAVEGQGPLDSNDIKVMGSCHPLEPTGKGHGWQFGWSRLARASSGHSAQSSFPQGTGSSFIPRTVLLMETPALCPC